MTIRKTVLPVVTVLTLLAPSVHAHDLKEHMKDGEKPDCAALTDGDHARMDANDPVMQAMMKQCAKASQQGERKTRERHTLPEKGKADPAGGNRENSGCAALKNADPATIDRNDPVIRAMLKKC